MWKVFYVQEGSSFTSLVCRLAKEVNGFEVNSLEAEPFAKEALAIATEQLLKENITVPKYCELIKQLDAAFNIAMDERPEPIKEWWMGDLWNCCDWCDESWNHRNSKELLDEAEGLYQNGI